MKVLVTGATGSIGKEALYQALLRAEITTVVTLTRRSLPSNVSTNPKLKSIIMKDFSSWPADVLEEIKDADAMIWALGTSDDNPGPNYEYPLAFQDAFIQVLEPRTGKPPFRYIHVSGKFVEQDQSKALWMLETPRKTKGRTELRTIQFAKDHNDVWDSFVVRPGGVFSKTSRFSWLFPMFGQNLAIRDDELGAFMAELAIHGGENDSIILNSRLVEEGRKLLNQQ